MHPEENIPAYFLGLSFIIEKFYDDFSRFGCQSRFDLIMMERIIIALYSRGDENKELKLEGTSRV